MTGLELRRVYIRWRGAEIGGDLDPGAVTHDACGYVCWDASPPAGHTAWRHKHTFLEAVHTALAFTQTDCTSEWILVGPAMLPTVRTMWWFKENEPPEKDDMFIRLGWLRGIRVFYHKDLMTRRTYDPVNFQPSTEMFLVGNGRRFTVCGVMNLGCNMIPPAGH